MVRSSSFISKSDSLTACTYSSEDDTFRFWHHPLTVTSIFSFSFASKSIASDTKNQIYFPSRFVNCNPDPVLNITQILLTVVGRRQFNIPIGRVDKNRDLRRLMRLALSPNNFILNLFKKMIKLTLWTCCDSKFLLFISRII